jgi:hypothetical protein
MFNRVSVLPTIAAAMAVVSMACSDISAPGQGVRPTAASRSETGSGGGGGGGGGGTTTTTVSPTSCATITSFSNSNGYYKIWAAIWTSFSYTNSCGYAVTMTMTYLNGNTSLVDFAPSSSVMLSGTIDEDWAAFSTPYAVTMTLTSPDGTVLDSRSALVTTKAPKSTTGG